MEVFTLESTDDTPEVLLDHEKGVIKIEGKSLPEDVMEFYGPVLEWLEEYALNPAADTSVEFKMEYFNSASSKQIVDILTLLEKVHEKKNSVSVKWFYQDGDEDIEEAGESYTEIIELPIELISC